MQVDLDNQVALVTGAGQGIGLAIAESLAANGARVVFSDINRAQAEAAAANHDGCLGLRLDVTDEGEVADVIDQIVGGNRLDVVVNNAGVNTLAHRVTIDEFPREEWDRLLDVDLNGLFLVSKAAAQVMRRQQSGTIINVASVAGLVPLRLQCAFVAAKAAVVNLTRAMAIELGPFGVRTNAVAAGSILTRGTEQLFYGEDGKFRESAERLLSHVPLGRPGTTAEVAHGVLFLAAPESSYVNGHVLTIDGGWTAGYTRDF